MAAAQTASPGLSNGSSNGLVVNPGLTDANNKPLLAINWENVRMSVSLVNTAVSQSYEIFPTVDEKLPSRRSIRNMKLKKFMAMKAPNSPSRGGLLAVANGPRNAISGSPATSLPAARPRPVPSKPTTTTKPLQNGNHNTGGRVAQGEITKSCHICGKGFSKTTYLKRHILSHSSVKPYKCNICGWGFFQFCNLKRHMASHNTPTGEGFKCVYCAALFSTKSVLSVHMRDAHGAKKETTRTAANSSSGGQMSIMPLKQEITSPKGTNPVSMNEDEEEEISAPGTMMASEIQKGASGQPLYSCTICSAPFEKVSTLNKHIRSHGNSAKNKARSEAAS